MKAERVSEMGHPCHLQKGLAGGGYVRVALQAPMAEGEGSSKVRRGRSRRIVIFGGTCVVQCLRPVFNICHSTVVEAEKVGLGVEGYVEALNRRWGTTTPWSRMPSRLKVPVKRATKGSNHDGAGKEITRAAGRPKAPRSSGPKRQSKSQGVVTPVDDRASKSPAKEVYAVTLAGGVTPGWAHGLR